jgi:hypothetical protein
LIRTLTGSGATASEGVLAAVGIGAAAGVVVLGAVGADAGAREVAGKIGDRGGVARSAAPFFMRSETLKASSARRLPTAKSGHRARGSAGRARRNGP